MFHVSFPFGVYLLCGGKRGPVLWSWPAPLIFLGNKPTSVDGSAVLVPAFLILVIWRRTLYVPDFGGRGGLSVGGGREKYWTTQCEMQYHISCFAFKSHFSVHYLGFLPLSYFVVEKLGNPHIPSFHISKMFIFLEMTTVEECTSDINMKWYIMIIYDKNYTRTAEKKVEKDPSCESC